MKTIIAFIIVLILVLIAGCKTEDIDGAIIPDTVSDFEECVAAGNPVMESYPRQCKNGNRTFTEELDEAIATPDSDIMKEEVEKIPQPYCGDDACDDNENCEDCWEDCRCGPQEGCVKGECKYIECGRDKECSDNDACTQDFCRFPTHPNSFCEHEPIEKCKHGDGCCAEGCDAETDSDCMPVCGNDICEDNEDNTCKEDCSCGNRICEDGETPENCPRDCSECGNDVCEYGEDPNNCPSDCQYA
ncbi:MAG: hypothetical protein ACE5DM_00085 [Candidatus Nanoarchaeia archaeon]